MWQRAKIISRKSLDLGSHGRTTWVEMGPPELRTKVRGIYSGKLSGGDCYRTNRYLADTLRIVWVKADAVELLARGPEDFADEVERISFEQWRDQGEDVAGALT
jgi:hypothetical protein